MSTPSRRRQVRSIAAGGVAFLGSWAVIAVLTPADLFPQLPRWKSTLFIQSGAMHFSVTVANPIGYPTQVLNFYNAAGLAWWYQLIPVIAVMGAAAYTSRVYSHRYLSNYMTHAGNAAHGFFGALLLAIVIADMRPTLSGVILIGLGLAAAFWIGSTVISGFSGSLPFLGFASVRTVILVGIVVLIGGIFVAEVLWRAAAVTYIPAVAAGYIGGLVQTSGRQGHRPPIREQVKRHIQENYLEWIVLLSILALLYIGIGQPPLRPP